MIAIRLQKGHVHGLSAIAQILSAFLSADEELLKHMDLWEQEAIQFARR
jgi:hypothetical protein